MELRQLRYFMAVAEELHFARAAERCKVRSEEIAYRVIDPPLYVQVVLAWKSGTVSPQVRALLSIAREIGKKPVIA